MNVSANLSSIQAHQTLLNNSAYNVANVNTDGFVPVDTTITQDGNNITTTSTKASDNGSEKSQTNLTKEIPRQIVAQEGVSVNVTAIKTQDEMLGTLLDLKA